jgi:hypothetical protein
VPESNSRVTVKKGIGRNGPWEKDIKICSRGHPYRSSENHLEFYDLGISANIDNFSRQSPPKQLVEAMKCEY